MIKLQSATQQGASTAAQEQRSALLIMLISMRIEKNKHQSFNDMSA